MHMLSRDRRRLCMFRGGVRVCNAWHGKMWLSRSLVDLSRYRKDDLEDCEEKAIVVDMIIHKLSMIMMDQEWSGMIKECPGDSVPQGAFKTVMSICFFKGACGFLQRAHGEDWNVGESWNVWPCWPQRNVVLWAVWRAINRQFFPTEVPAGFGIAWSLAWLMTRPSWTLRSHCS